MESTEAVYTMELYKEIKIENSKLEAEIYKLNVIIQDYKDRLEYVNRLHQNLKVFDKTATIEKTWIKVGYKFLIDGVVYTVKGFKYKSELVSSFVKLNQSNEFEDSLEGETISYDYRDYYVVNKIDSIVCEYWQGGVREKDITIWFSLVNEGFTKENLILE